MEPLSLDDLKQRVRRSLETFPTDYGYEGAADAELQSLIERVQRAESVEAIYDQLGLDSFMAY